MAQFKYKSKINNNEINICVEVVYKKTGECKFKKNKSKEYDSHNFRLQCEEVCGNYKDNKLENYEKMCNCIGYLAITKYIFDNISEIEYIEFISDSGNSIYTHNDVKKFR